jgi:hypothetical protein
MDSIPFLSLVLLSADLSPLYDRLRGGASVSHGRLLPWKREGRETQR